jgi:hypothetical protein
LYKRRNQLRRLYKGGVQRTAQNNQPTMCITPPL